MQNLFDEVGPSSDATSLLKNFLDAKLREEKAKREKEMYRARLVEQLCRKLGKLTEDEYKKFESTTDTIPGAGTVTVFAKETSSWDSEYLEGVLNKAQLKKAKKYSWHSEARITQKG
jgi:DNA topoisomerase VI subunit B